MERQRGRVDLMIGAGIVVFGLLLSMVFLRSLWTLDADGLSQLNRKLPIWDFSNLWAGGLLALQGKVGVLFEPQAYRETLRALFTPLLTDQEWSYPPSMLLVAMPLALLPSTPAYFLWTLATIAGLWLAIRPLGLPLLAQLAVITSPAVVMNVLVGQNGAFTASLLIGGLLLAPRRPLIAGVLFGLLTVKPHLGLLVPVCLLAAGNYRAIAAAIVTTALLVVTTGALFGFEVWHLFRTVTAPMMTAILEAPYPQSYHTLALTAFSAARSLGLGVTPAYAVQVPVTLACIGIAFWLHRPSTRVALERKVVLTGMLALVASPYGYVYDAVPLGVATALLFLTEKRVPVAIHGMLWLFPLTVPYLALSGFGAGILVVILYLGMNLWLVRADHMAAVRACAAQPSR